VVENVVTIIDDDGGFRESLKFMLESLGYKVVSFASAGAFLATNNLYPTHLIVDHNMPEMTGLELAARLLGEGREIPFRLMTAAPTDGILQKADELGIGPVFVKPFDEDELLKFVRPSN
jgi:two-component system response regulator FixJ